MVEIKNKKSRKKLQKIWIKNISKTIDINKNK